MKYQLVLKLYNILYFVNLIQLTKTFNNHSSSKMFPNWKCYLQDFSNCNSTKHMYFPLIIPFSKGRMQENQDNIMENKKTSQTQKLEIGEDEKK